MARSFSRHEQFLRIFSLLEILADAHSPLSDDVLIAAIRDRLGLSRLSSRTLRRDCEFLTSCGYPIDHVPLAGERKYGWKLQSDGPLAKKILAEPLTLVELVAFRIAREQLRPFEGTPPEARLLPVEQIHKVVLQDGSFVPHEHANGDLERLRNET